MACRSHHSIFPLPVSTQKVNDRLLILKHSTGGSSVAFKNRFPLHLSTSRRRHINMYIHRNRWLFLVAARKWNENTHQSRCFTWTILCICIFIIWRKPFVSVARLLRLTIHGINFYDILCADFPWNRNSIKICTNDLEQVVDKETIWQETRRATQTIKVIE